MSKSEKWWKKRWFRVAAGIIVTGAALWLSFRKISWAALFEVFKDIEWVWVAAALGNVVLSVYVMGWRLKILLKSRGDFSLGTLFRLNMVSQYWNIILPARGGDVVKAYLVSQEKVEGGFAAGVVVLERIFEFIVFGILVLAVPFFWGIDQEWWPGANTELLALIAFVALIGFVALIAIIAIAVLKPQLSFPRKRESHVFIKLAEMFSRLLPQRFRKTLGDFFATGVESFQVLKKPLVLGGLVGFSLAFVGIQALSNYFVFWALGLKLSFWAALIVLLTLQVASIPPSSPGKLGIFEYMVILALAVYGIGKTEALGYAVLLHLVVYVPKIVMGGWFVVKKSPKKQ